MLIEYLSVSQCEDDTEEDQSKCLARQKHDGSSVMIMASGESVASMPLDKERASQTVSSAPMGLYAKGGIQGITLFQSNDTL